MKKILLSIMTIVLVVSAAAYGTRAYFTDTESVTGNTFSTGTIAISVGGSQTGGFSLKDMKPGYTDYINFTVNNDGSNPVNLLKKVVVSSDSAGLSTVIDYDMNVEVYTGANGSGTMLWHQMLYDKNVTFSSINDKDMFMGMVPKGGSMKVSQSYHMQELAGNTYQGQTMTFDITVTGEQLKGTLVLRPKSGDPKWLITYSNVMGTLTYGVKDSKFNFSFAGQAPLASTAYSLIAYHESFSSPSATGWPRAVTILGSATSDGTGLVSIPATSTELNMDLLNMPVWLVPTADLSGNTLSVWNQANILFETGLMDYYDSDL
jgi:predicted ribosomally synthesized peptide with SipW-like signal peptide